MTSVYSIQYPRRVLLRRILRWIARGLLRIFTQTTVTGQENLPANGPLLLVGNHVAMIEAMLMVVYVPWPIEIIGTGDIPIDKRFRWAAELWGFLPVNRGSVDRREMQLPLDVLKQGGVVGIFPEGAIWSTTMKQAHTGVAWLSYRTATPVVPIGYGGTRGALAAIFALKRPRMVMNIGPVLPAVDPSSSRKPRKQALADAANAIMEQVRTLIPPEEKLHWDAVQDETFDFSLIAEDNSGEQHNLPITHTEGLGRFFHIAVILDVMERNMQLPVSPLRDVQTAYPAQTLSQALDAALNFFAEHPNFLSYRFGYATAQEILAGVQELRQITQQTTPDTLLKLQPIRRYRTATGESIIESVPGQMHTM